MTHTHHELSEVFPEFVAEIHRLKLEDRHFARLADDYHEVNRRVHRMETDVEPTSDEELERNKKERLRLLDAIRSMLANAA